MDKTRPTNDEKGFIRRVEECEGAFGVVKDILTQPPVMGRPEPGHDLHVFLAVTDDAISTGMVQEKPQFKLVYFVSRTLKEA